MSAKEVSMRKIRELLRLHLDVKLSQHQIANSLNLSVGVVNKYVKKVNQAGLTWPLSPALEEDKALKQTLFPLKETGIDSPALDFAAVHAALKQPHVTLQLLWDE